MRARCQTPWLKQLRLSGLCSRLVSTGSFASRRVPAEVLGQLEGDGVRQRHCAGLAPLGPVDDEPRAQQLQLLFDMHLLAKEVDIAQAQSERLVLSQATSRGDYPNRPVAIEKRADDRLNPFDGPRLDLALLERGQLDGPYLSGVGGDEPVVDGSGEHRRDVGEDRPHVGGCQVLL